MLFPVKISEDQGQPLSSNNPISNTLSSTSLPTKNQWIWAPMVCRKMIDTHRSMYEDLLHTPKVFWRKIFLGKKLMEHY